MTRDLVTCISFKANELSLGFQLNPRVHENLMNVFKKGALKIQTLAQVLCSTVKLHALSSR